MNNKQMYELTIDPEFRDLIPPLADDELELLEQSIRKDGCETPLTVWHGVLVDGHNRYGICQKHNILFTVTEKDFADRDEALLWIISNQLGRRNLTSYQKGVLALKFEPILKAQANKRRATSTGGAAPQLVQNSSQAGPTGKTRDHLGRLAGISHDTIEKVKKLTKAADPDTKQKLQRGEVSINKAYTELMHREHADETRACGRCGQDKPITEFSIPSNRHGFSELCRNCEKEIAEASRKAAEVASQTTAPVQTILGVAMHKGHPIHVEAPLPDCMDMFPNLEDHMRFVVGNFLAGASNAMRLYTPGMVSPGNTKTLRKVLASAADAVAAFDDYVKEMHSHA